MLCWLGIVLARTRQAAEPRFAYTVNTLDQTLARYEIDAATGQVRFLDYLNIGKSTPEVSMDPTGQHVIALSQAVDRAYVYRLDQTSGALSEVKGEPFDVKGRGPFQITFHPNGRFAYIAHRFAGVGAYAYDAATGSLAPLPGSPYPAQQRTRSVVVEPGGRFLYALNAYSNSISTFRIDAATGALAEMPYSPMSVGDMGVIDYIAQFMPEVPDTAGGLPYHLVIDPQGKFLFTANIASANISVFRIDAKDGHLTEVEGSPFYTGFNPYGLTVHPSGRFVYALRAKDSLIVGHRLDPETGRLSQMAGPGFSPGGQEPVELVFSPDGRRGYVANFSSNDVSLLDVDPQTGGLSVREVVKTRLGPWAITLGGDQAKAPPPPPLQIFAALGKEGLARFALAQEHPQAISPIPMGGETSAVALSPDGAHLYALDQANDQVRSFQVLPGKNGLAAVANGTVATGKQPTAIAVDRNGWYLYVTNRGDNSMSVYFLDPDDNGIPKPVKGSPVPAGDKPVSLSLDPAGRYAYVVNAAGGSVSVYRFTTNASPLVFESINAGSPFPVGEEPVDLVVEPTGQYAYVADAGSDAVSAFRVHHQTGALTALPGSPFKAGQRPVALVAHRNGRWLYVASQDSADIRCYRIEAGLGAIAPVGEPLKLAVKPARLWLDPRSEVLYVLAEGGRQLLQLRVAADTGALSLERSRDLPWPVQDIILAPKS